jgi:hypothetical protein
MRVASRKPLNRGLNAFSCSNNYQRDYVVVGMAQCSFEFTRMQCWFLDGMSVIRSARKPPVPSSPRIIWQHFGEKGPLIAGTLGRSTVRPERRDCSHLRKPRNPRESKNFEDGVGGGHETESGDDCAGG